MGTESFAAVCVFVVVVCGDVNFVLADFEELLSGTYNTLQNKRAVTSSVNESGTFISHSVSSEESARDTGSNDAGYEAGSVDSGTYIDHTDGSINSGTYIDHTENSVESGTFIDHTNGSINNGTFIDHTENSVDSGTFIDHTNGSMDSGTFIDHSQQSLSTKTRESVVLPAENGTFIVQHDDGTKVSLPTSRLSDEMFVLHNKRRSLEEHESPSSRRASDLTFAEHKVKRQVSSGLLQ